MTVRSRPPVSLPRRPCERGHPTHSGGRDVRGPPRPPGRAPTGRRSTAATRVERVRVVERPTREGSSGQIGAQSSASRAQTNRDVGARNSSSQRVSEEVSERRLEIGRGCLEGSVSPAVYALECRLHRLRYGHVGLHSSAFVVGQRSTMPHTTRPIRVDGNTDSFGRKEPRGHDAGTVLEGQIDASKRPPP